MELWTVKDIQRELNISRKKADALLSIKGCPCLPRHKGGKYLVPADSFVSWVKGRTI